MITAPCPRPGCGGRIEVPPPGVTTWSDDRTCDRCGHVNIGGLDLDGLERRALLERLARNMTAAGVWTDRLELFGDVFTVERTAGSPGRIVEARQDGKR